VKRRRPAVSASRSRYLGFLNAELSTDAAHREFAAFGESALRLRRAAAFRYLRRLAKYVRRG
jgi:hypothetical protein